MSAYTLSGLGLFKDVWQIHSVLEKKKLSFGIFVGL